jgi:mannose-6-phosphate isomerase-like protein (cupin superfamily)
MEIFVMRRVVTDNKDDRSYISSDEAVPENPHWDDLWVVDPAEAFGHAPDQGDLTFTAPAGGFRWRVFKVPTDVEMKRMYEEATAAGSPAPDPDGWHRTNTLDLMYVLEGEITLQLEDDKTVLRPGDLIVQRGTNHAWHNYGDKPVRLLGIMRTLP